MKIKNNKYNTILFVSKYSYFYPATILCLWYERLNCLFEFKVRVLNVGSQSTSSILNEEEQNNHADTVRRWVFFALHVMVFLCT